MQRNKLVSRRIGTVAASLAICALGAAFVQQANAGCSQSYLPKKTASWYAPGSLYGAAKFVKADYRQVSEDDYGQSFFRPAITGVWAFQFISKGNLGTLGIPDGPFDNGNTLWFADGNEMTVSGARDPASGDVCVGVWKQTGEWTYELTHIGLGWNVAGNPQGLPVGPGGPGIFKELITLGRDGNSYSGTFTLTQLGPDGKTPALPAPIKGLVVATRVTQNTTTQVP
jgi:hypothetical protein